MSSEEGWGVGVGSARFATWLLVWVMHSLLPPLMCSDGGEGLVCTMHGLLPSLISSDGGEGLVCAMHGLLPPLIWSEGKGGRVIAGRASFAAQTYV